MARTTLGTISGDRTNDVAVARPLNRQRAKAAAAGTPTRVAMAVLANASCRLVINALVHDGSRNTMTYQSRVSPSGGNTKYRVVVNDTAMTTSSGAIRNR